MARKTDTKKPTADPPLQTAPPVADAVTPPTELHATPELLRGVYTNLASVSHTTNEFVLDFAFAGQGGSVLVARVITSPRHAKALGEVLAAQIGKYEGKFGAIKLATNAQASGGTPQAGVKAKKK